MVAFAIPFVLMRSAEMARPAGLEPAAPCLAGTQYKTLSAAAGVAYEGTRHFLALELDRSRTEMTGVYDSKVRSREKRDLKRPTNPVWGAKLGMAKPLFAGTVARVIESRLPTAS
jgi:hypothetical protein